MTYPIENVKTGTRGNFYTHLLVLIQGTLTGLVGMTHGLAEIQQGNRPTGGLLLTTIGAFTIIPNFLISGIAATLVGIAIAVWTIGFIRSKNGPAIFLLLSALLFLVGGGFAPIGFLLITWGVSTQINNPLTWWRKILSENLRKWLAKLWLVILISGYLFLLMGVSIWLFINPPTLPTQNTTALYICWAFLMVGLLLQPATIICGFARDIERQNK